jgi:hypothetical protein
MNQQRGRGETIAGIVEITGVMGGGNNVGDELAQSVEHQCSLK